MSIQAPLPYLRHGKPLCAKGHQHHPPTMALLRIPALLPPPTASSITRPSSASKKRKQKKELLLPHHHLHLRSTNNHNNRCHSPNGTLLLTSTNNRNPPVTTATTTSGESFHKKLKFLETELGVDPFRALDLNPDLRSVPLQRLRDFRSILLSFGFHLPGDSSRILFVLPQLLSSNPNRRVLPSLRFLRDFVPLSRPGDLRIAVLRCPRLLITPVDGQLLPALHFLRRLGFDTITPYTTLYLISSVERTLIPKLDYFRSLGFSYEEAVHMVHRNPALFSYSIEHNFRPKLEFLVGEMGRDVAEVADFPRYFSYSLEDRIKPRHRMLVERGLRLTLPQMLLPRYGEFQDNLVDMWLGSFEKRRGQGCSGG